MWGNSQGDFSYLKVFGIFLYFMHLCQCIPYTYGSNFSGWIFCQMNVTFSSTLSIIYTKFYYRMIKTKIFSDISFHIRVIIYFQINHKIAVCLSICLSIFCNRWPCQSCDKAIWYKKISNK